LPEPSGAVKIAVSAQRATPEGEEIRMSDFSMTIGGEAVATEDSFGVVNPATAEVFAHAPECSRDQLDAAMDSAAKAYREWRSDEAVRRQCLRDAAGILMAQFADLAPILTAEQGKPLNDSNLEMFGSAMWCQYFADLEIPRQILQDDDEALVEVVNRPLGVVAAITPWNFPVNLAFWKIAPALLAGNTMVLKPSPFTPLSTLKIGELLRPIFPPGVLNVVSGGDDLGAWMTSHPVPRKISFTGSIETGKLVAAAAAPDLKRLTLELGGNDPAIILDDADPSAVADGIFGGAFANNGQICSAIKRVYVPERLYDDVVEALSTRARAITVGDGTAADTKLGPINNAPQYERVKELVADAIAHGATASAGGSPLDRPGYFFEPTILSGLSDGVRIVDEEQFGPALPVISYRDVDDVVDRANGTHFGLSGSVWGTDTDRAAEIAGRLEAGTAWVNTHLAMGPQFPFGGFKWSGIGVENGPWGLHEFTDIQTMHRSKTASLSPISSMVVS
jgi:acyl-CoA reductase-like NAD-dependent aldehyde dehydrogenase